MTDYPTLIADMANHTGTVIADDPDFAAALPAILAAAELRIYRELNPIALVQVQTVILPGGAFSFAAAADFVAARSMLAYDGTVRTFLLRRDNRFLAEFWPDATLTGTPKYWAEPTAATLLVAPTPTGDTTVELEYLSRPEPISALNPAPWIAVWVPDLLLAACMIGLAAWTKNYGTGDDPQQPAVWEGRYQVALSHAKKEEAMRRGLIDVPATA